jgi:hypothetical protein
MVRFGRGLEQWTADGSDPPRDLKRLSLQLAHACRESLRRAHGVEVDLGDRSQPGE